MSGPTGRPGYERVANFLMARRTYTFWEDKLTAALVRVDQIRRVMREAHQLRARLDHEYDRRRKMRLRRKGAQVRHRLRQLKKTKIPYYRERLEALKPSRYEVLMQDDAL